MTIQYIDAGVHAYCDNFSNFNSDFPNTVLAGDLAILCIKYYSIVDVGTPSGWGASVSADDGSNGKLTIFTKICSGSEDGTTVTSSTGGSAYGCSRIFLFRGAASIPYHVYGAATDSSAAQASIITTPPPINNSIAANSMGVCIIGSVRNTGPTSTTSPSGWTEIADTSSTITNSYRYGLHAFIKSDISPANESIAAISFASAAAFNIIDFALHPSDVSNSLFQLNNF